MAAACALVEYEVALDELGVGSRLMDYNRLLGELGECANGPLYS